MMAAQRVVGSETRYWKVQVTGSKTGVIVGSGGEDGEGKVL